MTSLPLYVTPGANVSLPFCSPVAEAIDKRHKNGRVFDGYREVSFCIKRSTGSMIISWLQLAGDLLPALARMEIEQSARVSKVHRSARSFDRSTPIAYSNSILKASTMIAISLE